jgi:hypothetical protein
MKIRNFVCEDERITLLMKIKDFVYWSEHRFRLWGAISLIMTSEWSHIKFVHKRHRIDLRVTYNLLAIKDINLVFELWIRS